MSDRQQDELQRGQDDVDANGITLCDDWYEADTWGLYPDDPETGFEFWPDGLSDPKRVWQDDRTGSWCLGRDDFENENPHKFDTFEEAVRAAEQEAAQDIASANAVRCLVWHFTDPDTATGRQADQIVVTVRRAEKGWLIDGGRYTHAKLSQAIEDAEDQVGWTAAKPA